jgi:adenosylcobinamide-GDP ribazoletransferase
VTPKDELVALLLAVQFLTRLPVPRDLPYSEARMVRAVGWYPAVGGVIGVLGAAVFTIASVTAAPVAAMAAVAATVLATGAFHEDGLADAADGLGGGQDREAALRIMRDSRIGSYGALALIAVLGLKVAALSGLSVTHAAAALIAGHTLSRVAPVLVIARTAYAREEGAKFTAPRVEPAGLRIALATGAAAALCAALALGAGAVLTGIVLGGLPALWFRRFCQRRIGGYTGDTLGATQQLAETGFYLGVLACL